LILIIKKIWIFLKNYWYVPFALGAFIFLWIVFNQKERLINFTYLLNSKRKSHNEQIQEIERIHKEEKKKREDIEK
jgi:hypothetical protein